MKTKLANIYVQCHPHLKVRAEMEAVSGLMKKAADICPQRCGNGVDCPAACPYCWATRVGGSVRLDSSFNPGSRKMVGLAAYSKLVP